MDCVEFLRRANDFTNLPLPRDMCDTPQFVDWIEHRTSCSACSDLLLRRDVEARGARVDHFPCVHLAWQATFQCDEHAHLSDCNKVAVLYFARFDEWSLRAIDGGDHMTRILSRAYTSG